MNAKEIQKRCERIFRLFRKGDEGDGGDSRPLRDFIDNLTSHDEKVYQFIHDRESEKKLTDFTWDLCSVAFAVGYTIGQMLDPGSKEIREEVEKLKQLIKEEELLLYLPKEKRKAA